MNVITLTEQTFHRVIEQHEVVILDFWAKWCEPCKSFAKVIEHVAPNYPEVVFASIDIDEEKELAADFKIASVPTVMVLKKRVVVFADSGVLPAGALSELIEKAKALDVSDILDAGKT